MDRPVWYGRSPHLSLPHWVATQSFTFLGDAVLLATLPLVAVHMARSPSVVAAVGFAATLPQLVVTLPAGLMVDRWERRRVMLFGGVLAVITLLVLAWSLGMGMDSLAILDGAAFVVGAGQVLMAAAAAAITPQIAAAGSLARANSWIFLAQHAFGSLAGPPLAGVLIAIALNAPLWAAAVAYACGLAVLASSSQRFVVEHPGMINSSRDVFEGIRIVVHHVQLRTITFVTATINLAVAAVLVVLVLYAVRPGPLGLSRPEYGVLLTCFALGGIVGATISERVTRWVGRGRLLVIAVLALAAGMALPGLLANGVVVGAGLAMAGVGGALYNVTTVSFRQRIIPSRQLGRATAAYRLAALGAQPIGAALGGIAATNFGLRETFIGSGILIVLTTIGLPLVSETRLANAERAVTGCPC